MKKMTIYIVRTLLLGLCLVTTLNAGTMPNIEKALESWQGTKEVHLQALSDDPLASDELLPLIEFFLQQGFSVDTSAKTGAPTDGLWAEVRQTDAQTLIVLRRVSDGSIIALERQSNKPKVAASAAAATTLVAPAQKQAPAGTPVQLSGQPVALVALESSTEGQTLALLSTAGVTLFQLKGKQLHQLSTIEPPASGLRPLALSGGDIDGDGSYELAAIWADDISSIYEGTDSQIRSQLLSAQQQKLTPLSQIDGYVRLMDEGAFIQQRGPYQMFSGAVKTLHFQQGTLESRQEQPWGKQGLFAMTPWAENTGLAWTVPGTLAIFALDSGQPVSGNKLRDDFGDFRVVEIAVRKEEPEFRSGFEKEDKVFEDYIPLPPRVMRHDKETMFTIYRGRVDKTFLTRRAQGEDRLARLKNTQDGLTLDYPFAPVKFFIIDFATIEKEKDAGVLLLLNDKANGQGQAYLLYQEAN